MRMNVHVPLPKGVVNGRFGLDAPAHARKLAPMDETPELPDIEALAAALGIPIQPEWHAAIRDNLATSLRLGTLVAELPLPDELDLAPVFRA